MHITLSVVFALLALAACVPKKGQLSDNQAIESGPSSAVSVTFTSPASRSSINSETIDHMSVAGSCSEVGMSVVISGPISASFVCANNKTWSGDLDLSNSREGVITLVASHQNLNATANAISSLVLTKDTILATLNILSPAAGTTITSSNGAAFPVSGSCSEIGRNVVISGDATQTVVCSSTKVWTANLNFSSAAYGSVDIVVTHQDAALNPVASVTRNFVKSINVTSVAITNPAEGSLINGAGQSSFAVSGACSESGRNVFITGDTTQTVVCSSSKTWTANLNFSAAAQGAVDITVTHQDADLNPPATSTRQFVKDTIPATVAISTPAAGSAINSSNVSSYVVSGTCSDSTKNVVISGDATQTVICSSSKTWAANLNFSAKADGPVDITVTHQDAALNPVASDSRGFVKYTSVTSVAITNPAAGSLINTSTQSAFAVSGTCSEAGRNVVISGDASQTVVCSSGKTWSANLNFSSAAQGAADITVTHQDIALNPAATSTRQFMKDTVAATVVISTPAAGAAINASNDSSYPVTGTCSESGRNVVISGHANQTVVCSSSRTWTANLNFSAANDGSVSITATHQDAALNTAATATRSFVKSTAATSVAITSPGDGSLINASVQSAFTVSGTCSEAGRNVVISGDATQTVVCSSGKTWTANLNFSAANQGTVDITATHQDAALNTAATNTRQFLKDTLPATVVVVAPDAGALISAADVSAFVVSGTCSENGRNVFISGGATQTVVCSSSKTWTASLNFSSAAQGSVSITVTQQDAALNTAGSTTRQFIKDTVGATVAISTPAASAFINASNQSIFTVTGTCSETNRNVVLSGDATQTVVCSSSKTWTADLDFSLAAQGTVSLTATHQDAALNAAATSVRQFTKDTVAASVAITATASGAIVNASNVTAFSISGTCSEASRNVVISGDATQTVVCSSSKTWAASLNFSAAAQGAISIIATHQDAALNPATTATRSTTKDTVAPTLAILTPTEGQTFQSSSLASITVSGTCSEIGSNNVYLSGGATAMMSCNANKTWSKTIDVSGSTSDTIQIIASHVDTATNSVSVTRNFNKEATTTTPVLTLTIAATSEAGSVITVRADLSSTARSNLSFDYATATDNTLPILSQAEVMQDYSPASGTITFASGDQTKNFTLTTLSSAMFYAPTKKFKLKLQNPQGLTFNKTSYDVSLVNSNAPIFGADVSRLPTRASQGNAPTYTFPTPLKTYYVDQATGNDSNNGLTENTAFLTIKKAATVAVSGTLVLVKNGTYKEEVKPAQSGTALAPIQYKAFPGHTPTITGAASIASFSTITEASTIPATIPSWPPLTVASENFENGLTGLTPTQAGSNAAGVCTTQKKFGAKSGCLQFAGTSAVNGILKTLPTAIEDGFFRTFIYLDNNFDIKDTNPSSVTTKKWNFLTLYEGATARVVLSLVKTASLGFKIDAQVITPNVTNISNYYKGYPGELKKNQWYQFELRYKGNDATSGGSELWLNSVSIAGNYDKTATPDIYYGLNTSGMKIDSVALGDNSSGKTFSSTTYPTSGSIVYFDDLRATVGIPSAELDNTKPLSIYTAPYTKSLYSGMSSSFPQTMTITDSSYPEGKTLKTVSGRNVVTPATFAVDSTAGVMYFRTIQDTSPSGKVVEYGLRDTGFDLVNRQYIVIQGFNIRGVNNKNEGAIYLEGGSQFNSIIGNNLYSNSGAGVRVDALSSPAGCDYKTAGCTVVKRGDGNLIAANHFYDNYLPFGSGIRIDDSSDSIIEYNLFESLHGSNISLECNDSESCHGNYIRYNTFTSAGESNLYVARYIFDSFIYGNIFSGAMSSAYDTMKKGVRGTSGGSGVHIARGSNNNLVFNNLIYKVDTGGITLRANVSDNVLFNNTISYVARKGSGTGIDYQRDGNEVALSDVNGNGTPDGQEPLYNNVSFNNVISFSADTNRCIDLEGYDTGDTGSYTPANTYDMSNLSDYNLLYKCGRTAKFNAVTYTDTTFSTYVNQTRSVSGLVRDSHSLIFPATQTLFMDDANGDFRLRTSPSGACILGQNCPWDGSY